MLVDNTVLLADIDENLQKLVKEFTVACEKRKLKVKVDKNIVMFLKRK